MKKSKLKKRVKELEAQVAVLKLNQALNDQAALYGNNSPLSTNFMDNLSGLHEALINTRADPYWADQLRKTAKQDTEDNGKQYHAEQLRLKHKRDELDGRILPHNVAGACHCGQMHILNAIEPK